MCSAFYTFVREKKVREPRGSVDWKFRPRELGHQRIRGGKWKKGRIGTVVSLFSSVINGSEVERGDTDTYCEKIEGCVGNESIADGGISFRHELDLRYWVPLQVSTIQKQR